MTYQILKSPSYYTDAEQFCENCNTIRRGIIAGCSDFLVI